MGLIVTVGVATVLVCAGIFELLERRKRAAFQRQIHDLAQKYIDKMKQEEAEDGNIESVGDAEQQHL